MSIISHVIFVVVIHNIYCTHSHLSVYILIVCVNVSLATNSQKKGVWCKTHPFLGSGGETVSVVCTINFVQDAVIMGIYSFLWGLTAIANLGVAITFGNVLVGVGMVRKCVRSLCYSVFGLCMYCSMSCV